MCPAKSVIAAARTRTVTSAAIRARESIIARALAKAIQIETCDSSRNRTMWNCLKVSIQ
jgi:hypothetical protein